MMNLHPMLQIVVINYNRAFEMNHFLGCLDAKIEPGIDNPKRYKNDELRIGLFGWFGHFGYSWLADGPGVRVPRGLCRPGPAL